MPILCRLWSLWQTCPDCPRWIRWCARFVLPQLRASGTQAYRNVAGGEIWTCVEWQSHERSAGTVVTAASVTLHKNTPKLRACACWHAREMITLSWGGGGSESVRQNFIDLKMFVCTKTWRIFPSLLKKNRGLGMSYNHMSHRNLLNRGLGMSYNHMRYRNFFLSLFCAPPCRYLLCWHSNSK